VVPLDQPTHASFLHPDHLHPGGRRYRQFIYIQSPRVQFHLLIFIRSQEVVRSLEAARSGVVQSRRVRSVWCEVVVKVRIGEKALALRWDTVSSHSTRLWAESPCSRRSAEEGVLRSGENEDVSLVLIRSLETAESRDNLADGDGVLVSKVVFC
jgi:hypothetical protein